MKIKISTKEIAEICGVSRGTVDRALNNRPGISAATKEKILKVARQYGYRPHYVARSLVKGKTMSIGLVIFDINNRIFAQLVNAIEARAREWGYFVYLAFTQKDSSAEMDCIAQLTDRQVDGIILMPVNQGKPFEQYLAKLEVPVVTFANKLSDRFPFVWIDDRQAVKDAVRHIASKGYEKIIYVSPPLANYRKSVNLHSPLQRYAGFQKACQEHLDIQFTVVKEKQYLQAVWDVLNHTSQKQAIFCTSDIYAIDIIHFLRDKNCSVPAQAGVMGFDNIDLLSYITPPLTTIDYSVQEIGKTIVDRLVALINGKPVPPETFLNHRIVERASL